MRLDKVYVDGFRNLKNAAVDFDEDRLTTVIIGQNGAGKSNLIEAIVDVFRSVDLGRSPPRFRYALEYRLDGRKIRLSNLDGKPIIECDGRSVSRKAFEEDRAAYFPDLVFGYYSGVGRRLEQLFDSHQRQYYNKVKVSDDPDEWRRALDERRLFFCRPIHGVFALLAAFAHPSKAVLSLLREKLGITGFHSALAVFREPWFSKSTKRTQLRDANDLWGAAGPAGVCARVFQANAFHPLALIDSPIDDYRDKSVTEAQLGAFIRNHEALHGIAAAYANDRELFAGLEAVDISDLIRDLHLWVTRVNDESGDIAFADLSDGERQLLMALGLIRISRGKRALFLLDEPDTHLNPHWQHTYLDLIREWTEAAANEQNCHIIMTSHNPLTIAALEREEVRVMSVDDSGNVRIAPPYTHPRGLGFTATLTEIFGLSTSLDPATQRLVDDRNVLARLTSRDSAQERRLIELNEQLDRLGFMFEDREPLYQDFLRSWQEVQYANKEPLSPAQIEARRQAMRVLIDELSSGDRGMA